jgi:hypothetical protein
LDALPIFLGILVFVVLFPPRFFMDNIFQGDAQLEQVVSSSLSDKQGAYSMTAMQGSPERYPEQYPRGDYRV